MTDVLKISRQKLLAYSVLTAGLLGASIAGAADVDFANPAVDVAAQATIESGSCIAKYTAMLFDASQPAEAVASQVAQHCQKEIARAAGLAAFMEGRPQDFAKNLKYIQETLTANAVVRYRESTQKTQFAQNR